jgi:fucose permease
MGRLSFADFQTMAKAYADEERRHNETLRINAAHTAWLLGADSGTTFGKFLTKWGVVEKKSDDSSNSNKVDTKALYAKADKLTEQLKQKGVI